MAANHARGAGPHARRKPRTPGHDPARAARLGPVGVGVGAAGCPRRIPRNGFGTLRDCRPRNPETRRSTTAHNAMTHVVLESCIRCKYTDCVDVCPVDCFREGPNFLVIDPDECIDCAVCIPECPVNAIVPEEDVPADQQAFIALNAELSRKWPSITRSKSSLADADEWKDVKDKLSELKR